MAEGIAWSTRITTIALEMVVPAVIGHLIDEKIGTTPVALLVGVILGLATSMLHLLRIASPKRRGGSERLPAEDDKQRGKS
jgi:ATP synthase protein I